MIGNIFFTMAFILLGLMSCMCLFGMLIILWKKLKRDLKKL